MDDIEREQIEWERGGGNGDRADCGVEPDSEVRSARSAKRLGGAAEGCVDGGIGCDADRKEEKAAMESQTSVSASASQTRTIVRQSGIPVAVVVVV